MTPASLAELLAVRIDHTWTVEQISLFFDMVESLLELALDEEETT